MLSNKNTHLAEVTLSGDTWNSLMEASNALRHALGNALQRLPSEDWAPFLAVRAEYDQALYTAVSTVTAGTPLNIAPGLTPGCPGVTPAPTEVPPSSLELENIAERQVKLTIDAPNGDKIVCFGAALDMLTLQHVYRTLLEGHRGLDRSEGNSTPIAYLRAKASSKPWDSFELVPATDANAFPVFGRALAASPLGVVEQVDLDDEEWGAHAWVGLHRSVLPGTVVYTAPPTRSSPLNEHGPVIKIIGIGPEHRPGERGVDECPENEEGVCLEFADGFRGCYYLSDIFAFAPSPAEELLQELASYIGCGSCDRFTPEELANRARVEFDRLSHQLQTLERQISEPQAFEVLMHGEKMAFKLSGQQFTLDYAPLESSEFEFMRKMLVSAFSTFAANVSCGAQMKGLSASEARNYLHGLHAGYRFGATSDDHGYAAAHLKYGAALTDALHAGHGAEQAQAWGVASKLVTQLLATLSVLPPSEGLGPTDALPRASVMHVASQLKEAVDSYSRYVGSLGQAGERWVS